MVKARPLRIGDHREAPGRGVGGRHRHLAAQLGRPGRGRVAVCDREVHDPARRDSFRPVLVHVHHAADRAAAEPPLGVGHRAHLAGLGLPAEHAPVEPGRRLGVPAGQFAPAEAAGLVDQPAAGKGARLPGREQRPDRRRTWPSGPGRPRPAGGRSPGRPRSSPCRRGLDVGHADVGVPGGGPLRGRAGHQRGHHPAGEVRRGRPGRGEEGVRRVPAARGGVGRPAEQAGVEGQGRGGLSRWTGPPSTACRADTPSSRASRLPPLAAGTLLAWLRPWPSRSSWLRPP